MGINTLDMLPLNDIIATQITSGGGGVGGQAFYLSWSRGPDAGNIWDFICALVQILERGTATPLTNITVVIGVVRL